MAAKSDEIADAIRDTFISPNEADSNLEQANVVDGLFAIARAIDRLATHVKFLGAGDAASPMGAVEFLAVKISSSIDTLSNTIGELNE